jgi:hypothetical protein
MRLAAMLGMVGVIPVATLAVLAGNLAAHPLFADATEPLAAKGGAIENLGILAGLGAVTCFVGLAGRWRVPAAVGALGVAIGAIGLLVQRPFDDVIRLDNGVVETTLIATLAASLLALANLIPPPVRSHS